MALTFHNDSQIKFEYNPTNIYLGTTINKVGASKDVPDCGIVFNDTNSIFVAKSGNDSNNGTQNSPVLTIRKAITLCTSTKNYIVILDSGHYDEHDIILNNNVKGIYSITGQSAKITFTNNSQLHHVDDFDIKIPLTKSNESVSDKNFNGAWRLADGNLITIWHTYTHNSTYKYYTMTLYFMITNPYTGEIIKNMTTLVSGLQHQGALPSDAISAWFGYYHVDILPLENGGFIAVYNRTYPFDELYVKKYGNAQSGYTIEINQKTIFSFDDTPYGYGGGNRIIKISNNKALVLYHCCSYYDLKTKIQGIEIDLNCNVVASNQLYITSGIETFTYPQYYYDNTNGYIYVLAGRDTTATQKCIYLILNYTNKTIVKTMTEISANRYYYFPFILSDPYNPGDKFGIAFNSWSIRKLSNGNIFFQWMEGSSNQFTYGSTKYAIIGPVGNIIKSPTTLTTTRALNDVLYMQTLLNGGISYFDLTNVYADTRLQTKRYYDNGNDYIALTNKIISTTQYTSPLFIMQDKETTYLLVIFRYDNYLYTVVVSGLLSDCIKVNGDCTLYNLTIENNTIDTQKRILSGSGNITLQYCTVQSKKSRTESLINHTIGTITGNINIQNTIIYYSDGGIILTNFTNCNITDSLFYFILYQYCVQLSSTTTANLLINHCVFFNNYGGVKVNNALITGAIKNSILYSNAIHDIVITNNTGNINLSNSIYTGMISGLASVSNCKQINPLFINEGAYGVEYVDLRLRSVYLGYKQNSPALELGDDGRDAGAYIMQYEILSQIRDIIILPKPRINISLEPVNPKLVTGKTGQLFTKRDGLQKIYTLTWNALLISDYNKLLKMLWCDNNSIYFYPDPITNNEFINCKLIYTNVNIAPQWPIQFGIGVQNVEIKLGHEFELIED